MRILGIDYGSRRIGLAITDELGLMAHGRGIINGGTILEVIPRITEIIKEEKVEQIVIGLPKKMNNTLGAQAKKVLEFVEQLKEQVNIPIITWDERLTTSQAEKMLQDVNLSRQRKRQQLNTAAAQLILQNYLEAFQSNT